MICKAVISSQLILLVEISSDAGQAQRPGGAMQQAAAQLSIQVGYAAAEDGFGHAQITGGSSKASSIHHLGKLQHVVEI